MLYPSIKTLLETAGSRYSLVIAVSKRARKIAKRSEEFDEVLKDKPVKIAINEIAERSIRIVNKNNQE